MAYTKRHALQVSLEVGKLVEPSGLPNCHCQRTLKDRKCKAWGNTSISLSQGACRHFLLTYDMLPSSQLTSTLCFR